MRAPEFWHKTGPGARMLAALLAPAGALYGLSVRMRQAHTHPYRAKARVLCVGNLTAGGTGKTPVAMTLGRMCIERGMRIVFLSRGYGGRLAGPVAVDSTIHRSTDVGDEPLLLATVAPTIVARDRARGAALADSMGADLIVMDDGFQNFQLAKDLSLLVIDSETGFGNGRLVPAGPLRERVEQGLQRAEAVVLMGERECPIPSFRGPIFRASLRALQPERVTDQRVYAMTGIG